MRTGPFRAELYLDYGTVAGRAAAAEMWAAIETFSRPSVPLSSANVFPVFWNVDETDWPLVNVTRFGILPSRLTQTGDACSVGNPGCSGWTQGQLPYITVAGDHVVTRGQHPVNYPMHGGVPQVNARRGRLQTAFFTGLCCSH